MKILSLHYLPSVLWMRNLLAGDCVIDVHEHFVKQTYRNRATLLSANGLYDLSIPVKKQSSKMKMIDLRPNDEVNWQRQHWETIVACYGSAPFFIHYADAFKDLYSNSTTSVVEFELSLLRLIIKLMKVETEITFSTAYIEPSEGEDLRGLISPKVKVQENFKPYLQVFAEKFPFQPNLSVMDVLFNNGPRSVDFIR